METIKGKTKKEREAEMIYHRLFADKLSTVIEFREATEMLSNTSRNPITEISKISSKT